MILAVIHLLMGISAAVGGIYLAATDGMGMPLEWLSGSPFDSFLWPGIILAAVVGGTQLAAVCSIFRKRRFWPEMSGVASFGILIWIFMEMYFVRQASSFLQVLYFGLGIITLVLAFWEVRKNSSICKQ